jgi:hypothetical protein
MGRVAGADTRARALLRPAHAALHHPARRSKSAHECSDPSATQCARHGPACKIRYLATAVADGLGFTVNGRITSGGHAIASTDNAVDRSSLHAALAAAVIAWPIVPAQTWGSPGADVGQSRRRRAPCSGGVCAYKLLGGRFSSLLPSDLRRAALHDSVPLPAVVHGLLTGALVAPHRCGWACAPACDKTYHLRPNRRQTTPAKAPAQRTQPKAQRGTPQPNKQASRTNAA